MDHKQELIRRLLETMVALVVRYDDGLECIEQAVEDIKATGEEMGQFAEPSLTAREPSVPLLN